VNDSSSLQPRLLLVDDDRLVLATIADGLRQNDFEITAVSSPGEALSLAVDQDFDLAILDIRMPEVDGIELAKRLRALNNMPIMFLSAYGDEEYARQSALAGAISFLVKPVGVAQLLPSIHAALARGAELDALRTSEHRLNEALAGENVIRMAVGVLMERRNLDRQAAFDVLRGFARSHRRKVREVADEMLNAMELLNLEGRPPKAETSKHTI
jgi:response regulator NasT